MQRTVCAINTINHLTHNIICFQQEAAAKNSTGNLQNNTLRIATSAPCFTRRAGLHEKLVFQMLDKRLLNLKYTFYQDLTKRKYTDHDTCRRHCKHVPPLPAVHHSADSVHQFNWHNVWQIKRETKLQLIHSKRIWSSWGTSVRLNLQSETKMMTQLWSPVRLKQIVHFLSRVPGSYH